MDDFRFEQRASVIRRLVSGERPAPPEMRMWLTARCNLSCVFCPHGTGRVPIEPENELTRDEWLGVIDWLGEHGCEHVNLTGGEPFLRREDCLAIMERVKSRGMDGAITMNATLLRKEDVRRIVEMGWDSVQVSLDGATAKIHDSLRGSPGCFVRVMKTLDLFRKARQKSGTCSTNVTLATVLTNRNYHEIPALVKLAVDKGCQSFRITPMVEHYAECVEYQIREEHQKELLMILDKSALTARDAGLDTNIGNIQQNLGLALAKDKFSEILRQTDSRNGSDGEVLQTGRPPLCFEPWFLLRIDPHGWMNCCVSDYEQRANLRTVGLDNIWHNSYFEQVRSNMAKGIPLKTCKTCCYPVYAKNRRFAERLQETHPAMLEEFRYTAAQGSGKEGGKE